MNKNEVLRAFSQIDYDNKWQILDELLGTDYAALLLAKGANPDVIVANLAKDTEFVEDLEAYI